MSSLLSMFEFLSQQINVKYYFLTIWATYVQKSKLSVEFLLTILLVAYGARSGHFQPIHMSFLIHDETTLANWNYFS